MGKKWQSDVGNLGFEMMGATTIGTGDVEACNCKQGGWEAGWEDGQRSWQAGAGGVKKPTVCLPYRRPPQSRLHPHL